MSFFFYNSKVVFEHTHKKKKYIYIHEENNSRQNGKNEATHFARTNADGIKAPTLCVHIRGTLTRTTSSFHHPIKFRKQHGSNYGMKDNYRPSQVPDKLPTLAKFNIQ